MIFNYGANSKNDKFNFVILSNLYNFSLLLDIYYSVLQITLILVLTIVIILQKDT
jgi:hypothetical protein